PDENGLASRLEADFRAAGWIVLREECDINHFLPVAGRNYADYLATRPGRLRTTLKRKAKKVEIVLKRCFDPADWAAYEEIYNHSWKPEEGDPALLRRFAEQESQAGHYLFGMALADGEPVAAQFWTVENGTAYIHKLAHLESATKLSPGTTLTARLLEEVIDTDEVDWVDF
ncbi:MAG: GNAT family N-acetyltransferase, partial [Desulfuromonadales bacterium]|nr:GNAT family N-acetyltransferase [Desulfuromonadales bacterium]